MRTTLKRGIGRGAALNGNGRVVLPPPTVAIHRYRQPPRQPISTKRLFVRVLGWLVLAIAIVVAGLGGGLYLYGHETLNSIAAHSKPVRDAQSILAKIPSPSQPAIALVAGYDHRAGDGSSYAGSNSDTVMLLRADPTNDTLSLLSFPRDLNVPIYCSGDVVYTHARINAAWGLCPGDEGPKATVDTVQHLTGLQINYLITLDFHGFKEIVNKLHGVYMNVDRRYYIPPNSGVSTIDLHPGYQKLDGGQSLAYVRYRHTDSDIYRNARQQLFMDALKNRLARNLSITDIPQIIGAIKGSVEIARGGGGAPGMTEIQSYAGLAYGLPAGHLFRNSISPSDLQNLDVGGAAELTTSQAVIDQVVSNFLHPDVTLPGRANAQALGVKTKTKATKALKPADVTTLVLNAGIVAGRAANTDYLLRQLGYQTRQLPPSIPANAPGQSYATTIYFDPVQPRSQQAAQQLKPLFGAHTVVAPLSPAVAPYAQQAGNPITVVAFGTSFDGTLQTPAPQAEAPQKQPPAVSDGVSATSGLASYAGHVGFTLMQPHAIASGSRISSDEGYRVYRPLQSQRALVMTFVQPNGIGYWQIEETTWKSAPILARPTLTRTIGGRRFALYTVGGHIHMVVLRQGNATYWVVNTLLDELSNETMLAIAKSLQPLAK